MQAIFTVETKYPYSIYLDDWLEVLSLLPVQNIAVIVDTTVLKHYPVISQHFEHVFTIPSGEASKSRTHKKQLEDQLFAAGFSRDCHLIAIGGGVTLDLVGFVAATFCRGVPVTYIPTSLLAMVDVCVGGKTGINTDFGKNTLGSFTSPKQVIIDTNFLTTLPKHEFCTGIVESLKHALIFDAEFFAWQAKHCNSILALAPEKLPQLILKNLQIKAAIVQQDEFEQGGIRQILNYGHTIGHAIETASQYQLSHGAAIALGILAENHIAQKIGILSAVNAQHIGKILYKFNSLTQFYINDGTIFDALKYDKKQVNQQICAVLLKDIGTVYQQNQQYTIPLASELLKEAIVWLQQSSQNGFCQFK